MTTLVSIGSARAAAEWHGAIADRLDGEWNAEAAIRFPEHIEESWR